MTLNTKTLNTLNALIKVIDSKKGDDIQHCDSGDHYLIVCTAYSSIHIKAIHSACVVWAKRHNLKIGGRDLNYPDIDWSCLTINNIVLHIMLPQSRSYFNVTSGYEINC